MRNYYETTTLVLWDMYRNFPLYIRIFLFILTVSCPKAKRCDSKLHLFMLINCSINSYTMNKTKISKTKRLCSTNPIFVLFIFSICSIYIYMWKKYSALVLNDRYDLSKVMNGKGDMLNYRNSIHSPKATIAYGKIFYL